jgi:hypothetical protein
MALPLVGTCHSPIGKKKVQGTDTLAATGDKTIIAAPGANKHIRLQKVMVCLTHVLDNSVIRLEDGAGGSVIWEVESEAAKDLNGSHPIDFGETGLLMSANTLLNLTIEIANSTAFVIAVGYVVDS